MFSDYFSGMNPRTLRIALILSFLILVVSIVWMGMLRHHLVIPAKTNALYSLEITWTKSRVIEVVGYWQDRLDKANALNRADFLLIAGFCSFFSFSILWLAKSFPGFIGRIKKVLVSLVIVAAILDVLEGISIHYWLQGNMEVFSPLLITITAIIKFLIVIPIALIIVGSYLALFFKARKE